MRSRNPPCLPEASLRLSPERRRPGTCCRRRSEASAGDRCRKQSRVPLRMTVAAAAPPGSPQPHMAAAPGPARPLRRSRTRPPGAGEGGGAPCPPPPPGAVAQPTAGQCKRDISSLPAPDWLFPCGPRLLLPAARREPMGAARGGARWAMGRWRPAAAAARALRAGTTRSWEPANRAPSTARGGGRAP